MDYDAVTVDTNVFHRGGLNLEEGIISQLFQFKDGLTQLVMSEIVVRELLKHLRLKHKESREKFLSSLKNAQKSHLLSDEDVAKINKTVADAPDTDQAVKKRLNDFAVRCGLKAIPAETAKMKDLIKLYFKPLPPFEPSGSKKEEFPDAIALLSLEAWASENKKRILAISDDGGWKRYAETSEWIDVQPDLATALEILQKHSEDAKAQIVEILDLIAEGKTPELAEELESKISDAVSNQEYYIDASSSFSYESDFPEVTFSSYVSLHAGDEGGLKIVRMERDNIVAQIKMTLNAHVSVDFTFTMHDSIDDDEVPIGAATSDLDFEYDAYALVEFSGYLGGNVSDISISSVEFTQRYVTIDCGSIEPDFQPDEEMDYDFEP